MHPQTVTTTDGETVVLYADQWRMLWRYAASKEARRLHLRPAVEALRNSRMERPPQFWRNGVRLA